MTRDRFALLMVIAAGKRVAADTCPECDGTILAPEPLTAHLRAEHSDRILPNGEYLPSDRAIAALRSAAPTGASREGLLRETAAAVVTAHTALTEPSIESDIGPRAMQFDRALLALRAALAAQSPVNDEEPSDG